MNRMKTGVLAGSALAAMAAGGVFGATVLAPSVSGAATASTAATTATTTPSSSSAPNGYGPGGGGPGGGGGVPHAANGITETVLTGDSATKATAAALAAVPGGTIQRVETDADGAKYEAHMTKADGTVVTVKLDANFKVTSVENGMR